MLVALGLGAVERGQGLLPASQPRQLVNSGFSERARLKRDGGAGHGVTAWSARVDRRKQEELCEFLASLIYIVSARSARATQQDSMLKIK